MEAALAAEATRAQYKKDVLLSAWAPSQTLVEGSCRPAFASFVAECGCVVDQEVPAVGGAIDQKTWRKGTP